MWEKFSIAFALFLIFEGVLPFLSPQFWRSMMLALSSKTDNEIRVMGFISMLIGLFLLFSFT